MCGPASCAVLSSWAKLVSHFLSQGELAKYELSNIQVQIWGNFYRKMSFVILWKQKVTVVQVYGNDVLMEHLIVVSVFGQNVMLF